MKKILKKNQIIVTALAVLIAVAGYLNYTDNLSKKEKTKEANNNTYDSVYSQDNLSDENGEIKSLDGEGLDSSAENSGDVYKRQATKIMTNTIRECTTFNTLFLLKVL